MSLLPGGKITRRRMSNVSKALAVRPEASRGISTFMTIAPPSTIS